MAYNDFIPIEEENKNLALEKELLDIFAVNSYSKNIFAAFKARIYANKLCKAKYRKANYKEYVEMLMVKNYPQELEKARLGAKFLFWLCLSVILVIIPPYFIVIILIRILVSTILIWEIVVPVYQKLEKLYQ
ncbi:MAG: hypothetical protein LBT27_04920 [Prevotellaceae bacterium]|jgi:hypothetical protein|nr:hypothetical protein [Prevotellaceae bacterium]